MAIQDNDDHERAVWSNVSQYWYRRAWNITPNIGRLTHHLAELASPFTFQ